VIAEANVPAVRPQSPQIALVNPTETVPNGSPRNPQKNPTKPSDSLSRQKPEETLLVNSSPGSGLLRKLTVYQFRNVKNGFVL
jgi:hypothetical protein